MILITSVICLYYFNFIW